MTIQNVINTFIDSEIVARLDSPWTIQRGLDIAANPNPIMVTFWIKYVLKIANASAAEIAETQAIYTGNDLTPPDFNLIKIPHEIVQSFEFDRASLAEFFFFGGGRVLASKIMTVTSGMVAYFALLMNSSSTTPQHIYIALNRILGDEYNIVFSPTEVTMVRDALTSAGLNPDKVLKLRTSA